MHVIGLAKGKWRATPLSSGLAEQNYQSSIEFCYDSGMPSFYKYVPCWQPRSQVLTTRPGFLSISSTPGSRDPRERQTVRSSTPGTPTSLSSPGWRQTRPTVPTSRSSCLRTALASPAGLTPASTPYAPFRDCQRPLAWRMRKEADCIT